jgi:MoxR-like ATPase
VTALHLDPTLRQTALTFAARLTDLKEEYVDRDEVVDVLALAVLCREHALLVGPPGTAKTALLEQFSAMLHARRFSYLLTRFTEPAELFGAIDVRSFQRDSVYRVNTAGMLPTAQIAFLDEIFHGSSAILNALLTLVNERTFHNGADAEPVDLITLFGATNEMPDDPLLLAFCDRFLFRCRLDYVPDDAVADVLSIGWEAERRLIQGNVPVRADASGFALADLERLQTAVGDVDLSGVRDDLAKILLTLREEAIAFSDRRAVKAQKAVAAVALLAGRRRAEIEDLAILANLWTAPYDEASIRRVIESHGVPLAQSNRTVRDLSEIEYALRELDGQHQAVSSKEECREVLRRLGRLLSEVRAAHPEAAETLGAIARAQAKAVTTLRERFSEEGHFDV